MASVPDTKTLADVYEQLAAHKNVLISGPPGTGKSRLMREIAAAFVAPEPGGPLLYRGDEIAIPEKPKTPAPGSRLLTVGAKTKVFSTTFDQNTKHSDFLRGIVPTIGSQMSFKVSKGILFEAAEFARQSGQYSLVLVDEINRGPAVSIFGSSMVALEPSKRLNSANEPTKESQSFRVMNDDGEFVDYYLPDRLFIVAAMNQADSSVDAMDVAFQRRFARIRLDPDEAALRGYFDLPDGKLTPARDAPQSAADVYSALVLGWRGINRRIVRGKGEAYQMGHGLLMRTAISDSLDQALSEASDTWDLMDAHLAEIFYGDVRGLGESLGAGKKGSLYEVKTSIFGDQQVAVLHLQKNATVYGRLLAAE